MDQRSARTLTTNVRYLGPAMEKWLVQIGLKGRALEIAVKSCEDNLVDDLSVLRRLAKDERQFDKAFPQAVIRSMLLEALNSAEHAQIQDEAVTRTEEADDRYRYAVNVVSYTLIIG